MEKCTWWSHSTSLQPRSSTSSYSASTTGHRSRTGVWRRANWTVDWWPRPLTAPPSMPIGSQMIRVENSGANSWRLLPRCSYRWFSGRAWWQRINIITILMGYQFLNEVVFKGIMYYWEASTCSKTDWILVLNWL